MGAELNAGTGKETTSVYSRVLDVHLARAFDVIADMVLAAVARGGRHRARVVLEEIAMYEDDPQDKVFDVLGEAVFGDHPLGRAIIGRAGGRSAHAGGQHPRLSRRPLPARQRRRVAAGSIDHDAARRAGRGHRCPATRAPA